jgi:hypothetical protein
MTIGNIWKSIAPQNNKTRHAQPSDTAARYQQADAPVYADKYGRKVDKD